MSIYIWREQTIYDGMLGWRPLQTDLLDVSGKGNNATWYGTGGFGTVANKTGARVLKNSSNRSTQYVTTPVSYQKGPITFCGWICYNSMDSNVWHGLATTSNAAGTGATIGTRPADNNYPTLALDGATIRLASSTASTNTWYFWAGISDGTTVKSYNNCVLANTGSAATFTQGGVWKLGCGMIDSGQTLQAGTDGWVRHCALWNRAISEDELLYFYNQTA